MVTLMSRRNQAPPLAGAPRSANGCQLLPFHYFLIPLQDEKVHFLIPHVASPQHVAPPQQVISPPGGRGSPEHQSPPCTALPSRASVTPGRSQTPEKPSPLSTYISQNSLEGTLSNMSTITESEEERPTRVRLNSLFPFQQLTLKGRITVHPARGRTPD